MNAVIGQAVDRVDGPAKVTGTARYAAEFAPEGLTHAALVASTVPRGRVRGLYTAAAEAAPGVLAVITHINAPRLPYVPMEERPQVDPKSGDQLRVFQDAAIHFTGQPLACVVAETLEQARHAARLIRVDEAPAARPATRFDPSAGRHPSRGNAKGGRPGRDGRGDLKAGLAAADMVVAGTYAHPREHHNAIEPHATIAAWDGDDLLLFDKTQWVSNDAAEIAHVFGIPKEKVRVVSPYVGGAFGSALRTWPHVTVAALAAKVTGRPVRVELSRRELYASIGYRPETVQTVRLGATRDGRLTAIEQRAVAQVARYEEYAEVTLEPALTTYACEAVATDYRLVAMDVNSPCPMRAPGIVTGLWALESAMDELAERLGIDPLDLRLRNIAETNQKKGLPWSSNELKACYASAAERFGWASRDPAPRSMRDGHERIGFGMATAAYHAERGRSSASVTVFANGTAVIRSASSDMGPGTYTSVSQVAAEALGLPLEAVRFELGDTDLPYAPVHGGSITLASVGSAVAAAAEAVKAKIAALGPAESLTEALRRAGLDHVEAHADAAPGEEANTHASSAFGAIFVEVRVDEELGTVRVARMVGAYDAGRIVNPKTARSQCIGGMIGGIGMALLEKAEWDPRFGKVMNANLAEYLVPTAADTPEMEVIFVPGEDTLFNPLGAKGLAEIAICGVAPAIASAIHHATGRRMRTLPIRPEEILAPRIRPVGRP